MKKVLLTILLAASSILGYAQFTPNNLVVLQVELPPKNNITVDSNFHLYNLIGQSNMSGRGVLTKEYTSISHPRVFMLDKNNQWVIAKHPLHFDKSTAGVGLGLSFAIKMAEANPNIKIGLIPSAVGGTSIRVWKEGALDERTGTHPYDDALRRAKFAMQYGVMKGILWHQGEAHRNKAYPAWAEDVKVLINKLRTEFNNPKLPFVMGEIGHYLSPVTDINGMLSQIVAQVPYTAKVSAEGLNHKGDNLHFDSPSQVILGERYAEKMLQLQHHASEKQQSKNK